MSDENTEALRVLKQRVQRGFSGFKVLLDNLSGRVESMMGAQTGLASKQDATEAELAKLTERVAKLEGHKEGVRDAREDTTRTLNEVKEVRREVFKEKTVDVERWKATAPIVIAIVTGIFGLITGILALLQSFLGGGSGH